MALVDAEIAVAEDGGATSAASAEVFPGPRPLPDSASLGSFASALRGNILAAYPQSAYERDAVSRGILGRSQLILSRPTSIRHVLIDNPGNYRRAAAAQRIALPIMGTGMILAEGEEWRQQRRAATPAFAVRTLPLLARHVTAAADRVIADLRTAAGDVDLFRRVQQLVLEVAGGAMFSVDMTEFAPRMLDLIGTYANRHGRLSAFDLLLPPAIPTWGDFGRRRFGRRWRALVAEMVAARRSRPAPGGEPDLFDLMTAKTGDGTSVTTEHLIDQVATMLAAGYGTTSGTLFWSLFLLASAPAAQQRVAAEVGPLDLGPDSAFEMLSHLPYTRAVVQETLRLYPSVHSIGRRALAADVAGGVPVPAGAQVMISPWVLHRHRRLWRDPNRFDPSRFLPGAPPPDRYAYIPFGVGPRACIGAQFAMTEAVLVLARLIQAFRIERSDDRVVKPFAAITIRPDPAPLFLLRPRAPS